MTKSGVVVYLGQRVQCHAHQCWQWVQTRGGGQAIPSVGRISLRRPIPNGTQGVLPAPRPVAAPVAEPDVVDLTEDEVSSASFTHPHVRFYLASLKPVAVGGPFCCAFSTWPASVMHAGEANPNTVVWCVSVSVVCLGYCWIGHGLCFWCRAFRMRVIHPVPGYYDSNHPQACP